MLKEGICELTWIVPYKLFLKGFHYELKFNEFVFAVLYEYNK